MAPLAKNLNQRYNYKDYLNWPDEERWEIIEGMPFNMSPAPDPTHQSISMQLSIIMGQYFQNKKCRIFAAPFDVRMSNSLEDPDENIRTVVQPDITVICNTLKIDNHGCHGAPDLIVEILSPSTAKKDMSEKYNLYEKYGVKEYWIVDPGNKVVHLYQLKQEKKYSLKKIYEKDETIDSDIFKDLKVDLNLIFT